MKKQDTQRLTEICRKVEETCMGMRVRRAARTVGNHYDGHLKPAGIKGTQFTLLNAIFLNPSVTIGQLAGLLLIDRTTLNRNLKPLEREGLIQSGTGKDLRVRSLTLTAAGETSLQQALPLWIEAQSAVFDILGNRFRRLADDLSELEKLTD